MNAFSILTSAVGALAIGGIGWWLTHYLAKPIFEFSALRKEVRRILIFRANVAGPPGDGNRVEFFATYSEFRDLGAKLDALCETATPLVTMFFRFRCYDLRKARGALFGMANSLDSRDGSKAIFQHDLEQALNLPLRDSSERIQKMIDRLDSPN
jgi:hypothetical protein